MEIYLVRHTTPDIEKGICYGQSDIGLTKDCEKEFKNIIRQLPEHSSFKVYSSPLKRCISLANLLSEEVIADEKLMELNFGNWELLSWDDIPQHEITPWMKDFVNVTIPNGESYIDLQERVLSFINDLIALNTSCIIITHAGVIRTLLAHILNIPLKDSFKIKIKYGDIFYLTKTTEQIKLVSEIDL